LCDAAVQLMVVWGAK